MTDDTDLSATMRDYLAEIYRLGDSVERDGYVTTSALAESLMVSAPAVNRMVTKLKSLGLLNHEPYKGISLTPGGEREALLKLRNQRIAECFLVNVMGFGWHEVHAEADRMSSAMSDSITDRMMEMAGSPTHSPHGEPIPDADGNVVHLDDIALANGEIETEYIVTRILTREADRLEYIAALGLTPGAELHLIHVAPFEGPMQLKLKNEYRIIGNNLAQLIRVKSKQ
jgi:DtxR family Mn-dependent transcriptional regulator